MLNNNLIAAIDIGKLYNSVAFMNSKGDILAELKKLSNNLPGMNIFWKETTRLLSFYNLDKLDIVMESSGPYWFGPYWWLKNECSTLPSASVTALNAQIVSGFKGKFSHKKQKTNRKDAKLIGHRFRFGEFSPVYVPEGHLLTLRFYTRYRLHLVQTLAATKTFFLSFLFLKMSDYSRYCSRHLQVQPRLFVDCFGHTSSMVITKYQTTEELAAAPIHELASLIETTSRGRITNAPERAALAKKMAKDSYPLPDEATAPIHFILQETLSLINFLEKQVDNADKKIKPVLEHIDDPIKNIPGIGPVFAAGIIAESGNFSRFKGHPQVANYFGIIPSMDDTGEFQSSFNHMTKTGNSYGRYYYIEGTNSLRKYNQVFKDYFQKKLAETSPVRFKRALGLTTRKFIRVYFALKVKRQKFDPRLHH